MIPSFPGNICFDVHTRGAYLIDSHTCRLIVDATDGKHKVIEIPLFYISCDHYYIHEVMLQMGHCPPYMIAPDNSFDALGLHNVAVME